MTTAAACARDIVDYWLGASPEGPAAADAERERWYRGGPEVDREIRTRFAERVAEARAGRLAEWESTPEGALAVVVLLDQFTRNIYRGTAQAYCGDALALAVAGGALAIGHDRALSIPGRIFLLHPFHHSESLAEQERGVALLRSLEPLAPPAWRAYVRRAVEGFARHRDVVARFGRFPHRNRVLGRASTPEEIAYLEQEPASYGQGSG